MLRRLSDDDDDEDENSTKQPERKKIGGIPKTLLLLFSIQKTKNFNLISCRLHFITDIPHITNFVGIIELFSGYILHSDERFVYGM